MICVDDDEDVRAENILLDKDEEIETGTKSPDSASAYEEPELNQDNQKREKIDGYFCLLFK